MTIHHFISAVTSNTKFICNCWGLIWLVQRPTGFCPINITFVHSVMDKTSSPQWAKSKKGKINGSHTKCLPHQLLKGGTVFFCFYVYYFTSVWWCTLKTGQQSIITRHYVEWLRVFFIQWKVARWPTPLAQIFKFRLIQFLKYKQQKLDQKRNNQITCHDC